MIINTKPNYMDSGETIPNLALNFKDAFENGVVSDGFDSSNFNQIEDINSVGSLVRDNFEAFNASNAIIARSEQSNGKSEENND